VKLRQFNDSKIDLMQASHSVRLNVMAESAAQTAKSSPATLEGYLQIQANRTSFGATHIEDLPGDLLQLDNDPPFYSSSKRLIDIALCSMFILLLAPVYAAVALAVKLTSPGPVLFRQTRLGLKGDKFACIKFRSMRIDAEEILDRDPELRKRYEESFKLDNDPRITPIGNFLRKTSLDELPQFFNVLRGDMTLIGPRPIVPREIEKYGSHAEMLLTVKPGLSGHWQVHGRSETTYDERVAMDMLYIHRRSISLDIKLMAMTVVAVFRRRGAQ